MTCLSKSDLTCLDRPERREVGLLSTPDQPPGPGVPVPDWTPGLCARPRQALGSAPLPCSPRPLPGSERACRGAPAAPSLPCALCSRGRTGDPRGRPGATGPGTGLEERPKDTHPEIPAPHALPPPARAPGHGTRTCLQLPPDTCGPGPPCHSPQTGQHPPGTRQATSACRQRASL